MFFNLLVMSMFMKDNFKLLGCKIYAQPQEKRLCLQMRSEPRAHTKVLQVCSWKELREAPAALSSTFNGCSFQNVLQRAPSYRQE